MEVRIAIETEIAGLAAERRSPTGNAAIQENLENMSSLISSGTPASEADYHLHHSIAVAAHNKQLINLLETLGLHHYREFSLIKQNLTVILKATLSNYTENIVILSWRLQNLMKI